MENKTNSKKVILWVVGGVIIVVAIVLLGWKSNISPQDKTSQTNSTNKALSTSTATFDKLTNAEKNAEVTKPVQVVTGPKGTSTAEKSQGISVFKLKAEQGTFSPSELVLEKGQRVQIEFIAVDADYDLDIAPPIGAYIVAKKGQSSMFGFDAEKNKEGVYTFSCRDYCPAGKEMKGKIVVK